MFRNFSTALSASSRTVNVSGKHSKLEKFVVCFKFGDSPKF